MGRRRRRRARLAGVRRGELDPVEGTDAWGPANFEVPDSSASAAPSPPSSCSLGWPSPVRRCCYAVWAGGAAVHRAGLAGCRASGQTPPATWRRRRRRTWPRWTRGPSPRRSPFTDDNLPPLREGGDDAPEGPESEAQDTVAPGADGGRAGGSRA